MLGIREKFWFPSSPWGGPDRGVNTFYAEIVPSAPAGRCPVELQLKLRLDELRVPSSLSRAPPSGDVDDGALARAAKLANFDRVISRSRCPKIWDIGKMALPCGLMFAGGKRARDSFLGRIATGAHLPADQHADRADAFVGLVRTPASPI